MVLEGNFPNYLHNYLALFGSKYFLELIKKYQQTDFFLNLTASLDSYFDLKSNIIQDLLDFLLEIYPKLHSGNIGIFFKDAVYYIPEFKAAVKKLLYDESLDLLDFNYGSLLSLIEEDLPTTLQENIRKSITILLADDPSQIKNEEVYLYRRYYLNQLLTLEREFVLEPPTKESYGKYLESLRTMSEKIKDIQVRFKDTEDLH